MEKGNWIIDEITSAEYNRYIGDSGFYEWIEMVAERRTLTEMFNEFLGVHDETEIRVRAKDGVIIIERIHKTKEE